MIDKINKSKKSSLFSIALIITLISTALIMGRILMTNSIRYVFLVWNIFLAWIPYIISLRINKSKKNNGIWFWLSIMVWLLFFPNAPYLLTDYIHVPNIEFGPEAQISLLAWFDVILLSSFIWIGYILGLESLNLVHNRLSKIVGKPLGWYFVAVVSVLSGYAIFIGRYARLNSWDVLRPVYLLSVFISWISVKSIIFTFMFAILIFISYIIYKELSHD